MLYSTTIYSGKTNSSLRKAHRQTSSRTSKEGKKNLWRSMADEIRADICGANRYNPMLWPCSSPVLNDIGSFLGYDHHMVDLKSIRSACEDDDVPACLVSVDDVFFSSSFVSFQDIQKSLPNQLLMDPKAFESFNLPPSMAASDWNQTLLSSSHGNERNMENNDCLTQDEITSTMNYIRDEMGGTQEETMMVSNPSSNFCQSFIESSSSSNVIVSAQPSFHPCSSSQLFDNNGSTTMATANYQSPSSSFMANSSLSPVDELLMFSPPPCSSSSTCWSKLPTAFAAKPSLPKQQPLTTTSFWNASTNNGLRNRFLPAPNSETLVPATLLKEKRSCTTEIIDEKMEETSSLITKTTSEPPFKRPRMETPSPLPTFKVRKEKLGDRITALQQLVSPFGKTDTASVLHEAVGYIKFLHDQVNVLSTPYMKNGTPINHAPQMVDKLMDNNEGRMQDLRSRGLCLVPISSTFPVAHEPTTEFWTPSFGGTFR